VPGLFNGQLHQGRLVQAGSFSLAAIPGIFTAIRSRSGLAIEGVAMAAEEAKDHNAPSLPLIRGILTLVLAPSASCCLPGGAGDWTKLANINDPLPQTMKTIVGEHSGWLHMLVWLGLFGLVASFHGIIIGYSRQIFALARICRLISVFAPALQTPHRAILAGGVIGIAAIYSDEAHQDWRPDIDRQHHHGGVRRHLMYIMEHAEPVQVAPQQAGHGAAFHRTAFFPCSPLLRWRPPDVMATDLWLVCIGCSWRWGYGYFLLTGQQRQTAALAGEPPEGSNSRIDGRQRTTWPLPPHHGRCHLRV
jgi:hypothetical protein